MKLALDTLHFVYAPPPRDVAAPRAPAGPQGAPGGGS